MKSKKIISMLKHILLLVILLLSLKSIAFQEAKNQQIAATFKSGNAKELAKHFGKTVDLSVLDKEKVYSKAQAELIIKDFFSKHNPTGFKVIHQGASKAGMRYGIGELQTVKGNFRVSFYTKKNSAGSVVIQQLRIDTND